MVDPVSSSNLEMRHTFKLREFGQKTDEQTRAFKKPVTTPSMTPPQKRTPVLWEDHRAMVTELHGNIQSSAA